MRTIEIALRSVKTEMIDTVVRWDIRARRRYGRDARVIGLVEGHDVLRQPENPLLSFVQQLKDEDPT